ncbi:MASE1 domain-containing protein [Streptomyces humicola]|uniref:MASE1 domain-containing protein n=1 Tax=Streptomyces humicola TaxID=2953240 RepID=UPI0027E2F235|nr:MASE1 domain-containing protein [Streptomyces humicola]
MEIIVVTAVYFMTARLGLLQEVTIGGETVTPLWPPTGVALFFLLSMGVRIWPGIALGEFAVSASISPVHIADIGIVAGNTLAPVCAYLMLRRVGFRAELDRLRDGLALVFLGALGAMLISATVGDGALALDGTLPVDKFWAAWSVWWTGDAMGVLLVTPVLFVIRAARLPRGAPLSRWVEAAALLVSVVVVTVAVTRSPLALLFLVFPVLMWAALRFQLTGAAPCALLVSVLTIQAATDHSGPFAGHTLLAVMVMLQALNGAAALTAILLAAITNERINTHRELLQACEGLAEVVDRLAPGRTTHELPRQGDERQGDERRGGRSAQ